MIPNTGARRGTVTSGGIQEGHPAIVAHGWFAETHSWEHPSLHPTDNFSLPFLQVSM